MKNTREENTAWNLEGSVPVGRHDFTANTEVDMGGGQVCAADVRYKCGETRPGVCECEADSIAGELVCSDTAP